VIWLYREGGLELRTDRNREKSEYYFKCRVNGRRDKMLTEAESVDRKGANVRLQVIMAVRYSVT
jgi:hypothetical protein